ncbi:dTDP-4-dehydrorhamnose reductase [Labilibaculum sp. A4]|uniref:dTDP-4-dehydrorhamnose reductase n=1 Tax=Labilibaculum euxinus TaxID=2686357 RepID=UPI000F61D5FC|nr:dTDP-4-dehydrorhamnose reductase [Labilibaculum euxinus]MDQ1772730.1 dTDP-4-dehydrorhamnose reductase [Labilibaculum euxinus]MWN78312.1 dTDP-4-dehydrorhamnose reductase [Labilibaculum euxinus]
MKILITGANGQLGSEINELSASFSNLEFVFSDLPELDICNREMLAQFASDHQIKGIINCAAYTAVDKAEEDSKTAELVNATAVGNLVAVAEAQNLKLIHISTDYVFDGTAHLPYSEEFEVSPLGVYGATKRKGEEFVLNSYSESIVIRTSWLYSSFGNNFVKTMLRLGKEREELGVIFDQVGTPTYARDLAQTCLEILSKSDKLDTSGKLYHFSNEGVASWFDFAKAIMEMGNVDCIVNPIETKDYPTPAKRPHYSVLNKAKIKADYGIEIPYWRDSLKECIQRLKELKEQV